MNSLFRSARETEIHKNNNIYIQISLKVVSHMEADFLDSFLQPTSEMGILMEVIVKIFYRATRSCMQCMRVYHA